MADRKLTKREARFVEEMANPNTKSKTEAAQKAGYSTKNARFYASRKTTKANISEAIEERKAAAEKHARITRKAVLGATAQIAFASIDDALDENGSFNLERARLSGVIHQIKKYKTKTLHLSNGRKETTVEVELYANDSALAKLGNYLGMEKQPDETPETVQRQRQVIEDLIARFVDRDGLTREQAVAEIVRIRPEALDWIN